MILFQVLSLATDITQKLTPDTHAQTTTTEAVRVASLLPLFRHTSITPLSLSSGLVGVRSSTAAAPCPGSYASEVCSHLHPEQAFLFRDHAPLTSVLRPSPESHISNKLQDLFLWLFTLIQSHSFSKGRKPGNLE